METMAETARRLSDACRARGWQAEGVEVTDEGWATIAVKGLGWSHIFLQNGSEEAVLGDLLPHGGWHRKGTLTIPLKRMA